MKFNATVRLNPYINCSGARFSKLPTLNLGLRISQEKLKKIPNPQKFLEKKLEKKLRRKTYDS